MTTGEVRSEPVLARTGGFALRRVLRVSDRPARRAPHPVTGSLVVPARVTRGEAGLLAAVLGLAAAVYAWDLDQQGWANAYYGAAAQAGSRSWTSWFFGSLEIGNAVSTDKPPAALWLMAASLHVFGLSSWALMLPQVLEALATIVLLYGTVRLLAGRGAALLAALILATTPVFVVLARFNDPDMLLTLLVTGAAYCTVRASRSPRRAWLVGIGMLLGLAFLTKWMAAFIPAPALALALVRSGPARRRAQHARRLALVAATTAASGLWWVVAVLHTPPGARPYADGSHGTLLDLMVGQDGFSRLGPGGMSGPNPVGGAPGILRLLREPFNAQIGWLLPLAVLTLALPLVLGRDVPRQGYLLFGGWFVTAGLVFSFMAGSIHPYYAVLLAPPLAALVGMGVVDLCRHRRLGPSLVLLAGGACYTIAVAAGYVSTPGWLPGAVGACAALAGCAYLPLALRWTWAGSAQVRRGLLAAIAAAAAAALLVSPATFAVATLREPVTGSDPLAGPAARTAPPAYPAALVSFLRSRRQGRTWAAAVPTAMSAGRLQLESREPVLPIGGFTGHTATPTLSQVRAWVVEGRLRYLVLLGPYAADPLGTPAGLRGSDVAGVVAWARVHSCPVPIPTVKFLVLRLGRTCPGHLGAESVPQDAGAPIPSPHY